MPSTFKNVYLSGVGKIMMGTVNADGSKNAAAFVGNAPGLSISFEIDTEEVKDSTESSRLVDLRLIKEQKASLKLTLYSVHAENLALMFSGTKRTISSGTQTDEVLCGANVGAIAGDLFKTKHENITITAVKKGSTTLTQGTDYEIVDAAFGQIRILTAQAGHATNLLTISYTYTSRTQVVLFNAANTERYIEFHGKNAANGDKKFYCELYRILLDPAKDFNLLQDEVAKFDLEGTVLNDSTKSGDANLGTFGRVSYVDSQLTGYFNS